jgi:hypothetical protein
VSDGTRTRDRLDHNQELYQLSYAHQDVTNLAVPMICHRGWMSETARLRAYRFEPGAAFEGGLVAAFERMQLEKETAVLDGLFVRLDRDTGALEAMDLSSGRADGTFASLLDFRLDSDRRRALTERALTERPGGVPRDLVEAVAEALEWGAALLAMIHTGPPAAVLEEAVVRCGGRSIADEVVDVDSLAQVGERLRTIASTPPAAPAG